MWRDVAGGGGGRGGVGAGPRARLGAGGRRVGGIDEVSLSSPLVTGTAYSSARREEGVAPLYQLPSYSLPLPSSSPTSPRPPTSGVVFRRPPPGHAKVRFLTPDSADPSRSCS